MITLKLTPDKRRKKKDNTYPLVFRINCNGNSRDIRTGYSIKEADWNNRTNFIKETHPDFKTIFPRITELRLRNFLTYDGEQLVSLDLKNSQPYNSILLLQKDFWSKNSTSTNYYNYITTTTNSTTPLPIMLCKSLETLDKPDVQLYRELVTNGTFYEYFGKKLFQDYGLAVNSRGKLKEMMFTVLFTGNKNTSLAKKVFKTHFPNVNLIFDSVKHKKREELPLLLQRIESELILKRICKRIAKEKPNVPLFTIHDSISTTISNQNYVEQVMLEECVKMIGEKPKIAPEYWDLKNITSTSTGENVKFSYEVTEKKTK